MININWFIINMDRNRNRKFYSVFVEKLFIRVVQMYVVIIVVLQGYLGLFIYETFSKGQSSLDLCCNYSCIIICRQCMLVVVSYFLLDRENFSEGKRLGWYLVECYIRFRFFCVMDFVMYFVYLCMIYIVIIYVFCKFKIMFFVVVKFFCLL